MSASSRSETVRKTFTANGDVVTLPLNGLPAAGLTITGTWTGTLQVEETFDGDLWSNCKVLTEADVAVSLPLTANQLGLIKAQGRAAVRVRASAWTSGSAVVVLNATEGQVGGSSGGGGGSTDPTAPNAVELSDGTVYYKGATETTLAAVLTQADFDTKVGSLTEAAPATDTASSGANGRLQRIAQRLSSLIGLLPTALGSTTAANSLPVTLSTDGQFAVSTGSLTETAPATDTASSGLNGRLQRIAQRLTALLPQNGGRLNVDGAGGTFPVTNANLDAATSTLLTTSDFDTKVGSLTEAAPATDTASSGLNGRLQRIAQNITTLIAATLKVNGPGANQAAVSGNPNWIGGSTTAAGGNLQSLMVDSAANPNLLVRLASGASQVTAGATGNADTGSPSAVVLNTATFCLDFGGTNWERHRNNLDVTLLASAARTTTQGPTQLTTYNLGAIIFVLDMTTVGTGSVTLTINEVDPASGKSILLLSGAAVVTNSTNVYIIDPMLTAAANSIAKNRITRTLSWTVTANNANIATYSLGTMQLVP